MAKLMNIGSLIDTAWDHYRNNFKTLVKINAWALLIIALNIVALFFFPLNANELERALTGTEIFGVILFVFTNLVVAVAVNVWIFNALILANDAQLEGKRMSMSQITSRAWKLFPQMLILMVELAVVYALSMLLPLAVYWLITVPGSAILPIGVMIALGFLGLLLFLPPLALLFYLTFAQFALVLDGKTGLSAIKESARLVKGRFWPVTLRLATPKILYFVLLQLGQQLLMIIFSVLAFGSGQGQTGIGIIATPTAFYVMLIFINPIIVLTDQLIYRQLKD